MTINPKSENKPMTRQQIIETVRSAQNGDAMSFSTLYENTHSFVFARARMYLENDEDAKDLTQTVFLIAYMNLGRLSRPESIFAWLGAITFRQASEQAHFHADPRQERRASHGL